MTAKLEGPIIGIDLGTTNSCVAVWRDGRVEIIPNDMGHRTTPSWVAFTDETRLIGEAAVMQPTRNSVNTIYDSKRLIGRRFKDGVIQEDIKLWPFEIIHGTDPGREDKPIIVANYKNERIEFVAEQISGFILEKMKNSAEAFLGVVVKNAVVTVPAYFNDSQRRATIDAGTIVGLNVIAIISEPTAAAMAYGLDKTNVKKNVLVFDLGGGTFDVSIASIDGGKIEIKAVNGDAHLGGGNFDVRIVNYLLEEFKKKHNKDIKGSSKALIKLRKAVDEAKINLSSASEYIIKIDSLYEGINFSTNMTRARFESLNMELFKGCIDIVDKCLTDAKMKKNDIDDIVLVGGSTRIPMVQQLLKDYFNGKELCRTINPDEAVAYGAAVHAATLAGDDTGDHHIILGDVTPLSLGVEVYNGEDSIVIRRNTSIPVKKNAMYTTAIDNQTTVRFAVYQGENLMAKDNHYLNGFNLTGFPPAPKGKTQFDVCFQIDDNGILDVSAVELGTKLSNHITIVSDTEKLSKEEIQRMVKVAEQFRVDDEMFRKKNLEEAMDD